MRFVAGGRAQHGLPHLSDWAAAPEHRPFRPRSAHSAVLATLDRLRDGGLVRRRAGAGQPLYQITRRGRAELRLHRLIWASLPVKVDVGP